MLIHLTVEEAKSLSAAIDVIIKERGEFNQLRNVKQNIDDLLGGQPRC